MCVCVGGGGGGGADAEGGGGGGGVFSFWYKECYIFTETHSFRMFMYNHDCEVLF